jgi:hypothetical protein
MITPSKALRLSRLWLRSNTVNIAVSIIVLTTLCSLGLIALQQSKIQQEISTDQQILKGIEVVTNKLTTGSATRIAQYNELNKHLDCLAAFFNQSDRSTKAITDIDSCTLLDTKTGVSTTTQ